ADLTVVGDSDQSIYAFRGATIRNIIEFEQDFPSARTIVLEQNYRSTQNILTAANSVIEENAGRRKKNLWTDQAGGEQITHHCSPRSTVTASTSATAGHAGRRKKTLWTDQGGAEQIPLYVADDEREEARYIGRQIDALVDDGRSAGDIAIFYRANAQSRALE